MTDKLSPLAVIKNPEKFASVFLKILDKDKKLEPFAWNRAQRTLHQERSGKDLVLKARQLGISTYVQGEMFRRTVTKTSTTITLAHDAETTQKLRRMADRFYMNCRFNGIQPARKYANATVTTYPEFDSVATIATAGSVEVGRGDTYSDIHGSEVAFWPDAEKIMAGAMQGGNPDIILESTPNGSQGYFYDTVMEAIDGDSIWKLHFFPWWFDDEYKLPVPEEFAIQFTKQEKALIAQHNLTPGQILWRRSKIRELKRLFPQEYPEDPVSCFLTSGNSYFGDTASFFTAPMNAQYDPTHDYYAGLDFGQTNDFTAMPIIDRTTRQMVDLLRVNRMEWKKIRGLVVDFYKKWHCKAVMAEMNSIGSPNIEALRAEGLTIIPFTTDNWNKAELMEDLYDGIHDGGLRLMNIPVLRREVNTFVSKQTPTNKWRLAASGKGHDDTVLSLGLCWKCCYTAVTDEQIDRWAKGQATTEDINDDLLEYMANSQGITIEKAKELLKFEVTVAEMAMVEEEDDEEEINDTVGRNWN